MQDCDNSVVVTDHKPLTKILGDRTLDEINSTRLFQLKQRTLWRFDIAHLPGSTTVAYAASRHPATSEFFATILGAEHDSPDSLKEALLPLFGKTRVMS